MILKAKKKLLEYLDGIAQTRVRLDEEIRQAVRAFVENDEAMPDELYLALQCEKWNTLPVSGGLLEQPDWLMTAMSIAMSEYDRLQEEQIQDTIAKVKAEEIIEEKLKEKFGTS